MDDHPVRITIDDDLRRSRLTVFFRLLLVIPHVVWLYLWGFAVQVAVTLSVPVHTPAWQESPLVDRLPYLQAVPLAFGDHAAVLTAGWQERHARAATMP